VILLKCLIRGFGRLEQRTLEFRPGLNVIFAPNEGGKSTLQRFLVGMLYGPLRSEVKTQRRFETWVDLYKPWSGADYGGILWCAMAGGRELEIHRSFARDENRIEIRTATGQDIAAEYEQQRNGDVLFARSHLGMPRELFEAVAVIRENRAGELNGHDSIRERIANLAQSGDEELSVRVSVQELQQALDDIGSERAPTRPYKQSMDRIEELQAEMSELAARRAEFQAWVEERNTCASRLAALEDESRQAARIARSARRTEAAVRVRTLEELEREINELDAEIEQSGGDPAFPSQHLEELDQLTWSLDSMARDLSDLRREYAKAAPELAAAREKRAQLVEYESLNVSGDADKVTEWFVSYMSANIQKDNAQRSTARLKEEMEAIYNSVADLGPAADPGVDWETRARQASEQEGEYSRKILEVANLVAASRTRAAELAQLRMHSIAVGALLLVIGCMASVLAAVLNPSVAFLAAGAAFVVASGIFLRRASLHRQGMKQAEASCTGLEREQLALQEMGGRAKSDILEAAITGGYNSIDEFLNACRQAQSYRQKAGHLGALLTEAETERDRSASELNELYSKLKQTLAGVNLGCSPATMKAQVDTLRANLRQFRDLDSRFRILDQKVSELLQEQSRITESIAARQDAIGSILKSAGVPTPEGYRESCRAKQRVVALLEKRSSRSREFQRLCQPGTLDDWRARLAELAAAESNSGGVQTGREDPREAESGHAPRLPYLPSVEQAEEEERRTTSAVAESKEQYAVVSERVRHAFEGYRTASEIEEDLAATQRDFRELDLNRRALLLAIGTIGELSKQQQESLAPQLNQSVERRFLRLCDERYSEVRIDPDFQVHVRESVSSELRKLDNLSRGTQDQLYFALRFGVMDLISSPDEPSPCLLDEPFAAYDGRRLEEALRVLQEEASVRQILLFTCRGDLNALASHSGHALQL
jgi:uncharacterized protein YhaN